VLTNKEICNNIFLYLQKGVLVRITTTIKMDSNLKKLAQKKALDVTEEKSISLSDLIEAGLSIIVRMEKTEIIKKIEDSSNLITSLES
jgi:hypothetical protein